MVDIKPTTSDLVYTYIYIYVYKFMIYIYIKFSKNYYLIILSICHILK